MSLLSSAMDMFRSSVCQTELPLTCLLSGNANQYHNTATHSITSPAGHMLLGIFLALLLAKMLLAALTLASTFKLPWPAQIHPCTQPAHSPTQQSRSYPAPAPSIPPPHSLCINY